MEIKKALEETGKAYVLGGRYYAKENAKEVLEWRSIHDDSFGGTVSLRDIFELRWQPYPIEKEIRPEKAGELWRNGRGHFYHTVNDIHAEKEIVRMIGRHDRGVPSTETIHNQNGWQRIHPPVEDDSIERIVVEGVTWKTQSDGWVTPLQCGRGGILHSLVGKPAMKLIAEIPK
jgi:hypothetical protein